MDKFTFHFCNDKLQLLRLSAKIPIKLIGHFKNGKFNLN